MVYDDGLFLGRDNDVRLLVVGFWVDVDHHRYLIFASIFITVKSVQKRVATKKFGIAELFKDRLFFTLIVSLGSTWVLWLVSSFLFFDPWHMFTSVSVLPR